MCERTDAGGHDFRPIRAVGLVVSFSATLMSRAIAMPKPPDDSQSLHHPQSRLIGIGGLMAWLMVGLPVIVQGSTSPWRLPVWGVAFSLFGILLAASMRGIHLPL